MRHTNPDITIDFKAAATSFLEEAFIPVNPDTLYTMYYAWSESFKGRTDDAAYEIVVALNLEMIELAPMLNNPIQF